MKRKIRKKDGTIVEVEASYVLKEGEEETPENPETPETPEEDAEALKKIENIVGKKIEAALKEIHENPVKKSLVFHKEDPTLERSVMETDSYLRSKRPFVKLSGKMISFVEDMKSLARNGIPKSLIKALNEG